MGKACTRIKRFRIPSPTIPCNAGVENNNGCNGHRGRGGLLSAAFLAALAWSATASAGFIQYKTAAGEPSAVEGVDAMASFTTKADEIDITLQNFLLTQQASRAFSTTSSSRLGMGRLIRGR